MSGGFDSKKGPYKSAITGAYFGILNIFLVFVPLTYSLYSNKFLFSFYTIVGILMLALTGVIPIKYKSLYNYDFLSIRYLYFVGTLSLVFYFGVILKYILNFGFSFSNIYIFILQLILILMSVFDIYLSAHKGILRMRTMYLRTIMGHHFKNWIVILISIIIGVLLLMPYYS